MSIEQNKKSLLLRKRIAAYIGILNNDYIDEDIKSMAKSRCEGNLRELKTLGSTYRLIKPTHQYMLVDSEY